ncbi:MAG: methyltransferase domain-containing protein [Leptolyngbya sp.]|nr:methyltransferase domain-containing protein [Leptolyngbya sp.]
MVADLYQRIQQFYDGSSALWEQMWGEHMHHGHYGPHGTHRKNQQQAQVDLIDTLLSWGQVQQAAHILDAGCGIGGSALYLGDRYQATVVGLTLSPVQAERAQARAAAVGWGDRVRFQVADVLHTPFEDATFDLIWSLESGEHYPDKAQFFRESYRLLKPGGQLLMATWCHRPTQSLAGPLTEAETQQLAALYQLYHLPYVLSLPDYQALAQEQGFQAIRTADWSEAVAPFWDAVIASLGQWQAIAGVLTAGWPTLQGVPALFLMQRGFASGLLRYGVLSAHKPT